MATPVDIIVQYILLRRDLKKMKNYNDGAIIAQACHASKRMRKVVLGIDGNENEINELSDILKKNSIEHYLWIEQPENIPTAIAVKPYYKKDIEHFFSKYKLYR
ncbi:unnamed protein product [Rotaria sp. Silwood1]|nr:unnamed protein product [Rotaria sp. Silwood1]